MFNFQPCSVYIKIFTLKCWQRHQNWSHVHLRQCHTHKWQHRGHGYPLQHHTCCAVYGLKIMQIRSKCCHKWTEDYYSPQGSPDWTGPRIQKPGVSCVALLCRSVIDSKSRFTHILTKILFTGCSLRGEAHWVTLLQEDWFNEHLEKD